MTNSNRVLFSFLTAGLFWAWNSCMLLAAPLGAGAPVLSLQDLIDGVSARSQDLSIAHFKLKMKCIDCQSPDGPPVLDWSYDLWKSGEKAACDIQIQKTKAAPGPRTERSRWDGRRGTGYVEIPQASPDRRFSGTVLSRPNSLLSTFGLAVITHEQAFSARMSIPDLLRQGQWEIIGARDIGGYRAWGVRQTSWDDDVKFSKSKIKGKSDGLYEVWLAPENGFAPLEITERWADSNQPLEQMQDVTLSKQDGVWIVSKATLLYAKEGGRWSSKFLYEVTEFSRQLPAGASFTIKFPVGTGVLDDTTHTSFIAGKVVSVMDPKSDVMHFESIDDYPEYKAMTDYSRGITEVEWLQCPASKLPIERRVPPK